LKADSERSVEKQHMDGGFCPAFHMKRYAGLQ